MCLCSLNIIASHKVRSSKGLIHAVLWLGCSCKRKCRWENMVSKLGFILLQHYSPGCKTTLVFLSLSLPYTYLSLLISWSVQPFLVKIAKCDYSLFCSKGGINSNLFYTQSDSLLCPLPTTSQFWSLVWTFRTFVTHEGQDTTFKMTPRPWNMLSQVSSKKIFNISCKRQKNKISIFHYALCFIFLP